MADRGKADKTVRLQRLVIDPLTIEAAAATDPGQVRETNEDAVLVEPADSPAAKARGVLCVVADGVGGHAAGEVASHLAVNTVRASYYQSTSGYVVEALRKAIEEANDAVVQEARRHPEKKGMGCTLTAALVYGDDLVVGHVGDSRAYLIRRDAIAQVTTDHSIVAEQVAAGILTPEQAQSHPHRNIILRALGQNPSVQVDVYQQKLQSGDTLVMCSDGLTEVVSDDEIGEFASELPTQNAVEGLVNLAKERGAPDNVTVAVLRVSSVEQVGTGGPIPKGWPIAGGIVASLVVASLIIYSAFLAPQAPSSTKEEQPGAAKPPSAPGLVVTQPTSTLTPYLPVPGWISSTVGAYLRTEPRTGADKVIEEALRCGTRVTIVDTKPGEPAGPVSSSTWYKVEVTGSAKSGFVNSSLVATDIGLVPVPCSAVSPTVGPASTPAGPVATSTALPTATPQLTPSQPKPAVTASATPSL